VPLLLLGAIFEDERQGCSGVVSTERNKVYREMRRGQAPRPDWLLRLSEETEPVSVGRFSSPG
jgi:hypothetical protein